MGLLDRVDRFGGWLGSRAWGTYLLVCAWKGHDVLVHDREVHFCARCGVLL